MATTAEELREEVRRRYAESARAVTDGEGGCGCGSGDCCAGEPVSVAEALYEAEQREELPDAAVLASLGCGNPTAVAELREGETVLDLGSGGGIDVILSAKRVGPTGTAYGLDMTDEMLALARSNAAEAGTRNVHFLKGVIEQIPLPAGSVDVVISNCVINLSVDKPAVLTEIARVLAPGGRIGISDIVAEDRLAPEERAERGSYAGCIAGALSISEYEAGLEAAGFEQVSVELTHEVADGMHGAIVKAVKTREPELKGLPVIQPAAGRAAAEPLRAPVNVLFVCVANSGRSVLAERLFRRAAGGRHAARSAGSAPGAAAHANVVEALHEVGLDASDHVPRPLDDEAVAWADVVVATCDDACPVVPGKRYVSWELPDPKDEPLPRVRALREDVDARVRALVTELDAGSTA